MYTILYDSCVTSIVDYAGEVIGFPSYDKATQLHLKAIRAYLGVPKNSCNVGVLSEVDWLLPEYRTRIRMIRQYSRMLNMEDSRLTKRIMLWDRRLNSSGTVSSWREILPSRSLPPLLTTFPNNPSHLLISYHDYWKEPQN